MNEQSGSVRKTGSLGRRLRDARTRAGLTQVELAAAIGVTQSMISDIERGDTDDIMGSNLIRAADALRVSPRWLMIGEDEGALPGAGHKSLAASVAGADAIYREIIDAADRLRALVVSRR